MARSLEIARHKGSTTAASASTASIAPGGVSSVINCPRATIKRAASVRFMTPAATAAAYSPTLCPSTHAGRTP